MDIATLAHWADFELDTASLGVIRCGPLDTSKKFAEFEARIRASDIDAVEFARHLLKTIARKRPDDLAIDAVGGGPALSEEEVIAIDKAEINAFCDKFITSRLRIEPAQRSAEVAQSAGMPGCDRLVGALWDYVDTEKSNLRQKVQKYNKGLLGSSLLKSAWTEQAIPVSFSSPPSPILKTNKALDKLVAHSEQQSAKAEVESARVMEVATKGVDLSSGLIVTSKGLAVANRSFYVSIAALVLSFGFSVLSWFASRESDKQAEALAECWR